MTGRFYLVTFDLENSRGREAEYTLADTALRFRFGGKNFWKMLNNAGSFVRTRTRARFELHFSKPSAVIATS
jgi:hypothetical protein